MYITGFFQKTVSNNACQNGNNGYLSDRIKGDFYFTILIFLLIYFMNFIFCLYVSSHIHSYRFIHVYDVT